MQIKSLSLIHGDDLEVQFFNQEERMFAFCTKQPELYFHLLYGITTFDYDAVKTPQRLQGEEWYAASPFVVWDLEFRLLTAFSEDGDYASDVALTEESWAKIGRAHYVPEPEDEIPLDEYHIAINCMRDRFGNSNVFDRTKWHEDIDTCGENRRVLEAFEAFLNELEARTADGDCRPVFVRDLFEYLDESTDFSQYYRRLNNTGRQVFFFTDHACAKGNPHPLIMDTVFFEK